MENFSIYRPLAQFGPLESQDNNQVRSVFGVKVFNPDTPGTQPDIDQEASNKSGSKVLTKVIHFL